MLNKPGIQSNQLTPTNMSNLKQELSSIWTIAWPLILSNLLNVAVGIADLKMVGILGVDSIAAVGISRQVVNLIMIIVIAASGGASVLIAHAWGAGDKKRINFIISQTLILMIATALLVITPLGLFFSRPLLAFMGAETAVLQLGTTYLQLLFTGSLFLSFNFIITGILLGVGRTKVSFLLLLGVNLLNIFFNYLLIYGTGPVPALGVNGAAVGTVLARFLGTIAGIWILRNPRFSIGWRLPASLKPDLALQKKIFYLGGPRSLQGVVRNFSRLAIIKIISLLPDPTRAVSAYSVNMQIRLISSFIGLAFMSSSMVRVGQNIGAGRLDQAERCNWLNAVLAGGIMTCVAILIFLFPGFIMGFFTSDPEVITMGKDFFRIIAISEPFMAIAFVLSGSLRGGGDPITPFVCSAVADLGIFLVIAYLGIAVFQLGFSSVAAAYTVGAVVRLIPLWIKFRQGKWKSIRL